MRGYVQVRIMHKGQYYHKNFGVDSALARTLAGIHLAEKRKEILMGRFGVAPEAPSKGFTETARLYFSMWSQEKDPNGHILHGSADRAERIINSSLIPYFGRLAFESITPSVVLKWRGHRLRTVLGTSVNREQAVLSSIFSHMEQWVQNKEIPAIKLPRDPASGTVLNPCATVDKAPNRKRKRVLSILELKGLKAACVALDDLDTWEICKLALKSLLRKKDLEHLEAGEDIDITQAKTQTNVHLPVGVARPLNFKNFKRRWNAVRRAAQLEVWLPNGKMDTERTVQMRDFRKTGLNLLKNMGYSMKLMSEFAGHADEKTTEIYMVKDAEHLKPLAANLAGVIDDL